MLAATALVAFTTFFATVGPADLALLFAAMTTSNTARERRQFALRGTLIGGAILLVFALAGSAFLHLFGITLPALRTAGGILLLLIAIDMVFARPSGATGTTSAESDEAAKKADISVFPLATPLIAGPGTISAVILLMTDAADMAEASMVIFALVAVLVVTYAALMAAIPLQRLVGITGLHVVSRVVGVLLAALAIQFIFDGIKTSGLVPGVA